MKTAQFYQNLNLSSQVLISIAIMLFSGLLMAKLTAKLKLPNVTGYILAGVAIGPYVLQLIPAPVFQSMDFITDIALAFIAFGIGKYFKLSDLQTTGRQVVIIALFEALLAALFITVSMIWLFHLPLPFSLLLGAIGSATAPASTIMTIRQYKAKGEFVTMVLQVVALDDAIALLAFSICAPAATMLISGTQQIQTASILMPLVWNGVAILLGILCGLLLHVTLNRSPSSENRLIFLIATIISIAGFCDYVKISPLLCCMIVGIVYVNCGGNKKIFKQLNHFSPAILLLFFVLSGMRLDITSLATAGFIGVFYFLVRILGKYLGAYLGSVLSGVSISIRHYLGLALVPQAGVSIGLAVLAQRILPPDTGSLLSTIILSSGLLYEMVGPSCAKLSLHLSHSIPSSESETP